MATLAVTGRIAPRGRPAAMYVGGAVVEPTRTPIVQLTPVGEALRELCDAMANGEVTVYSPQDQERLDCDEARHYWRGEILRPNPDPHGNLSALQSMEIPF